MEKPSKEEVDIASKAPTLMVPVTEDNSSGVHKTESTSMMDHSTSRTNSMGKVRIKQFRQTSRTSRSL